MEVFVGEFEYKENKRREYREKSEILLRDLPNFCRTYERGIEGTVTEITIYSYLQRLHVFFTFLHDNNSFFSKKEITRFTYDDLTVLEAEDIEEFNHYIRSGKASNGRGNKESSVNHYLCALNSFWDYAITHGRLRHNVIKDVKRGKKKKREVITLNSDDESGLFQSVNCGTNLTDHQAAYRNDVTIARDNAICLTLVRTGLRVSELVGINLEDINFKDCYFHVNRKEDKIDNVYFSDQVKEALEEYLRLRPLLQPSPDEHALFLVTIGKYKGTRLSVRSVQLLVKKYAVAGSPGVGTKMTPHKMRSTYATNLLRASGSELTLVQEALNHESPSTTSIYLKKREQDLKNARNIIDGQS